MSLNKLKEMLCAELEEYSNISEINSSSLDMIYKLTDTIKNICKIEMLDCGESKTTKSTKSGRTQSMMEDFSEMLNGATERERKAIAQCIDILKNM